MMDQLFSLWPTAADMARDIGENPVTVRSWRTRGSIPAKHDLKIIERARQKGGSITFEDLARARASSFRSEDAA